MELLNKVKTSAGILSMVAATGLVSIPLPVTVRAETSVQTAAPAEVDWGLGNHQLERKNISESSTVVAGRCRNHVETDTKGTTVQGSAASIQGFD